MNTKATATQDLSARKRRRRDRHSVQVNKNVNAYSPRIQRPERPIKPRKPTPPMIEVERPARSWGRYLIGSAHRITLRGYPAGVVGGLPMDDDPFRGPDPGGGYVVGRADPDAPEGASTGQSAPPPAEIAPHAENAPAASPGRWTREWYFMAGALVASCLAAFGTFGIPSIRGRLAKFREDRRRRAHHEAEMSEPPCRTTIRGIGLRINGG